MQHKPGCENMADYLSRSPLKSSYETELAMQTEAYMNFITRFIKPNDIRHEVFVSETLKDETLVEVKKLLLNQQHNVKVPYFSSYAKVKEELTISSDGSLLKNTKLVIPLSLQEQVLNIAHRLCR